MSVRRLFGVFFCLSMIASCRRALLACLTLLLVATLGAAAAFAQTAPATAVNTTSGPQVVTVSIGSNFTLGKISILTEGVASQDFKQAAGGTCAVGTAYTSGETCTVRYTFTPQRPGTRSGAVMLYTNASPAQAGAIAYLQGIGNGPQLIFSSNTITAALRKNVSSPSDLAVDGAGNVFLVDSGDNAVKEILAAGGYGTVKNLAGGFGFNSPEGLAIDGADNVFVADTFNNAVEEIVAAGGYTTVKTLGGGYSFAYPYGVAVDGSGNVFVADTNNNAIEEIVAAGGYTTVNPLGGGFSFNFPTDVAVDGSGNLFVADFGNNAVEEIPATGGYSTVTAVGGGFDGPDGVSVDAVGNVFVADSNNQAIKEILALGDYTTVNTVGGFFDYPPGVAVDGSGNVYVADSYNNVIYKLDLVDPPSLIFANADPNTLSLDSPRTVTVANDGNEPLAFSTVTYPQDFPEAAAVATDCALTTSLSQDLTCTLSIDFLPLTEGSQTEYVALKDNTLNANPGAAQSVTVSGAGLGPVAMLAFGVLPPSVVPMGGNAGTITVVEEDENGNVESPAGDSITLVVTYPDATQQTYTATASEGVATFDLGGASLTETGTYTYTATVPGLSGVTGATATDTVLGSSLGVPTAAQTSTVQISSNGTLGSIAVLTQGAPNLDFQLATGGTCTIGTVYTAGETCTVDYTFNPLHPGPRYGAVVLYNNASSPKPMALGYLQGTGNGPQAVFSNTTAATLGHNFYGPYGVAVDGAGNVFVADTYHSAVKEVLASSGLKTTKTIGAGFFLPSAVAVDGAGNVFVADTGNTVVKEIVAAGGYRTVRILGSGFVSPIAVALDGSGNVFVADSQYIKEILSSDGYTTVVTLASSFTFNEPEALAVDGSDNVFAVDYGTGALYEIPASGGYSTVSVLATGLAGPSGVAVDGADNVFFTQAGLPSVYELLAVGGYATEDTLGGGLNNPGNVAVDGSGNVYVADFDNNAVKEVNLSSPPSLAFSTTLAGQTSANSPQTITVSNDGNQTLNFTAITYPQDFPDASPSTDCSPSTTLGTDVTCTLTIDFSPLASSATAGVTHLNESLVVADNDLTPSQSDSLSGSESMLFGAMNSPVDAVTKATTVTAGDGVLLAGWAADVNQGAPISNVAIYINCTTAVSSCTPVANVVPSGIPKPGVAATYGSRYLDAGWSYTYTGTLAPGTYTLIEVLSDSAGLTTQLGPRAFTVSP